MRGLSGWVGGDGDQGSARGQVVDVAVGGVKIGQFVGQSTAAGGELHAGGSGGGIAGNPNECGCGAVLAKSGL
ncbi:hypothetical protein Vse01_41550 [Micromonospora sediminimaris]|uniref:Uncharacterized protein n=1 Tax=Micromonospora sediminimaris TaxID=547162 RepID=A0A9W5UTV0_9ACTN|nr:hypothetical protein Vse01_41550 [Micromonospora sediminimaris]